MATIKTVRFVGCFHGKNRHMVESNITTWATVNNLKLELEWSQDPANEYGCMFAHGSKSAVLRCKDYAAGLEDHDWIVTRWTLIPEEIRKQYGF